jgi:hypothetical protein
MENNPEKAIQLFLQFVDQAPVCDKQLMKSNKNENKRYYTSLQ